MTFKRLSEFFQKLESTSSRNSMVEILAELFKETSASEIGMVTYLMQGRVAPLFEPVEFGMAEKMVLKALSLSYEETLEKVTEQYKKAGDLGIVTEELGKKAKGKGQKELSVEEVFQKLYDITQSGGEGSVEKKIGILSDLLQNCDPISARFIARTPVDKLRLGFSDMTVLEGLSWMIDGTKKNKAVIEAAYNIRPDLGYVASQIKKEGILGLTHVKPKVGTPILVMRAERLTNTVDILEKAGPNAAVEPKLDGLRTQLHYLKKGIGTNGKEQVRLFSRGMENVTTMYPDLVEAALKELRGVEGVILDGESIGFDPKTGRFLAFAETVQRKRKYGIAEFSKNVPIQLVTFDCLFLNGESLLEKPYATRRGVVEKMTKGNKIIVAAEMKIIDDALEMENYFQVQRSKGLEGMMAKKMDGAYQAGARGFNWIKLKGSYTGKLADTIDAVVMGVDFGQGKRSSFGVGAFLIGVYDPKSDSFKTVSKVGTGLTDDEWRELKVQSEKLKVSEKPKNYDVNKINECDVWISPSLVGEFRADELTKSPMHTAGYALRFPRLVRWREKKAEDTTSVKEIEKMVALQKK